MSRRRNVSPPLAVGLLALRHRLVADQSAQNLARIAQIHAASLPRSVPFTVQAGPDKQKTPEVYASEAFTNASTLPGVERGRYSECA